MQESQDIRWKQRFQNFEKALKLLRSVIEKHPDLSQLNDLEKEGTIQRFNFTLELAWKMIKDKMEFDGIDIKLQSPKAVLKQAYQARYIDSIDIWLAMINDRNLVSHKYDFKTFEGVLQAIANQYWLCLEKFYLQFLEIFLNE